MAMNQRTLYKTIEKIAARQYPSDDAMLTAILREIIANDRTAITGGRIWKLDATGRVYELVHEEGTVQAIGSGFRLALKDYPIFKEVALHRSVLAEETNRTLRRKGIMQYSATGIGDRVLIGGLNYYEYLMAFDSPDASPAFKYLLSMAGQAVTQMLAQRRSDAEVRELQNEMEHARDLQKLVLPQHEQRFGSFELYGVSLAERIVGGDFFNYLTFPDDAGRLGVAVGDAASKGMPAAVQALLVSGALMMSVEFESKVTSMLRRINKINCSIFPNDRFLTLFYCEIFEGESGLVLYANAGHSNPIQYHAAEQRCSELTVTGPVIGLLPDARYTLANTTLAKDDILVLFTDGITEANDGEDEYGERRLEQVIMRNAGECPKRICQEILQDVQTFSANGVYSDDKTLVVIKRVR